MTKQCPTCGATLRDQAKFCTVCGTNLETEAPPQPSPVSSGQPTTDKSCPRCGHKLKGKEKFCTRCGAQIAAPPTTVPVTSGGPICANCGNARNPPESDYCIQCGHPLSESVEHLVSPQEEIEPIEEGTSSSNSLATKAEQVIEVEDVEPLPIPTEILGQLIARGHQLSLEEEYAKTGNDSDQLLEDLSEAAGNSSYPLEELIDTYINERSEVERLDQLHESGEVSERVYERLTKEYDEKLEKIDKEIQDGVEILKGYFAQLRLDFAKAKDDLETIEARIQIGDVEEDPTAQKEKLTEKLKRLSYALTATQHILNKEAMMRGAPPIRFAITETTLTDAGLDKTQSIEEVEDSKPAESVQPETQTDEARSLQEDAESGKICNSCGRVTASDAKFCIHCGHPLT